MRSCLFFSGTLTQREIKTALSKIWTRVSNSISKEDNRYANQLLYKNNTCFRYDFKLIPMVKF